MTERERILNIIRKHKINVDDCYWCSIRNDYDKHECCGQDGADISFTKKSYEAIWENLVKMINDEKPKKEDVALPVGPVS